MYVEQFTTLKQKSSKETQNKFYKSLAVFALRILIYGSERQTENKILKAQELKFLTRVESYRKVIGKRFVSQN